MKKIEQIKIGKKIYPKTLAGVRMLWEDDLCESDEATLTVMEFAGGDPDETADDYIARKFNEAEAMVED